MKVFSVMRNRSWCTILTLVTCLQVANMSINASDSYATLEDVTINEIETCVEFVLEMVMGHENAISETHEHENTGHKPTHHFVLIFTEVESPTLVKSSSDIPKILTICDMGIFSGHGTITSPPPKLLFA